MNELQRDPGRPSLGRAVTHLGPGIAYVALIFAKGTEREPAPTVHVSDKTLHAVAFGVMVPFALLGLRTLLRPPGLRARLAISVGVSSLLGALLELWQAFLPYRSAELLDWVADTVGATLVGALVLALASLRRRGATRGAGA